jgi:outer membrane PBP1 activator LpoA protein
VDLNAKAERERLSKSALKGFFKLVATWKVRDEDARQLLGGVSSSSYYDWKKHPERTLEVDCITRISYLLAFTRHCTSSTATNLPMNGSACPIVITFSKPHTAGLYAGRRLAGHANRASATGRAPWRL